MISFSGYSLQELEEILAIADRSQTQCDGCSRLVSHLLTQKQVQHFPRTGQVIASGGRAIALHYWVELLDDFGAMWRIDYRLQHWLGEGYPHGIFRPQPHHPLYLHFPVPMFGGELSPAAYFALTWVVQDDVISQLPSTRQEPEISCFSDMVLTMHYNDHEPPHFHVRHGRQKALVAIQSPSVIEGDLRSRAVEMLIAWAKRHRNELMENWKRAQLEQPLQPIAPLEQLL